MQDPPAPAPRLPRSTLVVGVLAAIVFALVGVLSCSVFTPPPRAPARAELPRSEPDVRVRVRERATMITIAGPSLLPLSWEGPPGHDAITTPVEALVLDGSILLRTPAGERLLHRPGEPILISPDPSGTPLTIDGHPYPGTLTLIPRTDDAAPTFDVVATMPIETYLPGVIAKELYRTWPKPAFEAQAICARSYALHERDRARRAARAYDLEATTQDQVFAGATDLKVAHDAVASTRGRVLAWDGQVLRAYYSSTSGGRAASAADVWPTGPGFEFNLAAPLQATPRTFADEASPAHRWERTPGTARLSLRIRRWGEENGHPVKRLGTLTMAHPVRVNPVGRPSRYALRDDAGREFEIGAEELRVACNWPVPGVPDVTPAERVRSGDLTLRVSPQTTTILGRGFGHGVGMCQYSAAALAQRGWDADRIVLNFYPGATIERAYR